MTTEPDQVWIPDAERTFVVAELLQATKEQATVRVDGRERTVDISTVLKINPAKFNLCTDLAEIGYLNEANVLENLKQRYEKNMIYTRSGLFLVAVNPYKTIRNLYGQELADHFCKDKAVIKNYNQFDINNLKGELDVYKKQPHIFEVASVAYQCMLVEKKNQSILITGESGAGKTENTKKVIEFLAYIAERKSNHMMTQTTKNFQNCVMPSSIENTLYGSNNQTSKVDSQILSQMIIETNFILEAFGNAQTIKNDNSSRFGKFIKIEFKSGVIIGAHIEKYLLEKSRVTNPNKNERNYHIFYMLLSALNLCDNECQSNKDGIAQDNEYSLFIKNIYNKLQLETTQTSKYQYLKNTNATISDKNDAVDFARLYNSLILLKFKPNEIEGIFKVLSAILHIGNIIVTEEELEIQGSTRIQLSMDETISSKVCDLLAIDSEKFVNNLLRPTIQAGREVVRNTRTREQAVNILEALSKLLYEKVFDFLIARINNSLRHDKINESSSDRDSLDMNKKGNNIQQNVENDSNVNFIGVLDIAGFEIFEKNDFEQFCINFTNEKLQQFYNHHMFVTEQEIYKKENIDWDHVDFGMDLQQTIDLIEKNNPIGILSYLDEECVMPKGNESSYLEKLKTLEIQKIKNYEAKYKSKKNDNTGAQTDRYLVGHSKQTKKEGGFMGIVRNIMNPSHNLQMASNRDFVTSTETSDDSSSDLSKRQNLFKIDKLSNGFILNHYAGAVHYEVNNWLTKNKDPHFDVLSNLMRNSTMPFMRKLFMHAETGKRGFFRTVVQMHKDSLSNLMQTLQQTEPLFVRCILPNASKRPNTYNKALVLHQLKCNGIMEGIRISRQGYPNRIAFKDFYRRYQVLCLQHRLCADYKEGCMKILHEIGDVLHEHVNQLRYETIGQKNKTESYNKQTIDINGNDKAVTDAKASKADLSNTKNRIKQSTSGERNKASLLYKVGSTMIFFKHGVLAEIESMREARKNRIVMQLQSLVALKITKWQDQSEKTKMNVVCMLQKNARISIEFRNWKWWKLYTIVKPLLSMMNDDVKIKELENKTLENIYRIEQLNSEKEQLRIELDCKREEIQKLRSDYTDIVEERDFIKKTHEIRTKEDKERILSILREHESKVQKLNNLLEEEKKLREVSENKTEELKYLENAILNKNEELCALKEELEIVRQNHKIIESDFVQTQKNLAADIKIKNAEIEMKDSEMIKLKENVKSIDQQNKTIMNENNRYREDLQRAVTTIQCLETDLQAKENAHKIFEIETNSKIEDLIVQNKKATAQLLLENSESTKFEIQKLVAESSQNLDELQAVLNLKTHENEQSRIQILDLERKLANIDNNYAQTKSALEFLETEHESAKKELASQYEINAKMKADLNKQTNIAIDLQKTIAEKEYLIANMNSVIANLQENISNLESSDTKVKKLQSNKIQELESKLRLSDEIIEQLKIEVVDFERCKKDLIDLQAQFAGLQKDSADAHANDLKFKESQVRCAELEIMNKDLETRSHQDALAYQKQLKDLEKTVSDIQAKYKNEIEMRDITISRYENELNEKDTLIAHEKHKHEMTDKLHSEHSKILEQKHADIENHQQLIREQESQILQFEHEIEKLKYEKNIDSENREKMKCRMSENIAENRLLHEANIQLKTQLESRTHEKSKESAMGITDAEKMNARIFQLQNLLEIEKQNRIQNQALHDKIALDNKSFVEDKLNEFFAKEQSIKDDYDRKLKAVQSKHANKDNEYKVLYDTISIDVKKLENKLHDKENELANLKIENKLLNKKVVYNNNHKFNEDLKKCNAEIDNLKRKLQDNLDEYVSNVTKMMRDYKKREADIESSKEQLIKEIDALNRKETENHKNLIEMQEKLNQTEAQLLESQALIADHGTKIKDYENTFKDIGQKEHAWNQKYLTVKNQCDHKLKTFETKYKQLEQKYNEEIKKLGNKHAKDLQLTQSKLHKTNDQLHEIKRKYDNLFEKYNEMMAHSDVLIKDKLREKEKEMHFIQKAVEKLKKEKSHYESRSHDLKNIVNDLQSEKTTWRDELLKTRLDKNKWEKRCKQTERELEEIKSIHKIFD